MAAPAPTAKGSGAGWRPWIEDRATRALIRLALALPWDRRVRLMGAVLRRGLAPALGWRARAMANIAHVHPDWPETRRRALADAVADNVGRTMIENYDPAGLLARMAQVPLEGAGVAALEAARAAGRPVLFVTGHFGNHEAPRAALVARGYRIGGLYRPMANPYFNAHYAQNMHRLSGPVFEQGRRGTAGFLRALSQGGMMVLLFDVYDSAGTPIDFLGRPAPTLLSAAEMATRTGALLLPIFGIRAPDGIALRPVIDAPIPEGDPLERMREATRRLEARIAESPEQWFWIHRRWKPRRQAKRQRKRAAPRIGP